MRAATIPHVSEDAPSRADRLGAARGARALAAAVIEQAISDAAGSDRLDTTRDAQAFLFADDRAADRQRWLHIAGVTATAADFRLAVARESAFREWARRMHGARCRAELLAIGPVPPICATSHKTRAATVTTSCLATLSGSHKKRELVPTEEEDI